MRTHDRSTQYKNPLVSAILVAAPIVLASLFYVWTHITTVELGYALSRESTRHKSLLEENRALRVEVAALRAPERLERVAKTGYPLAPPAKEQIVHIDASPRSVGLISQRGDLD